MTFFSPERIRLTPDQLIAKMNFIAQEGEQPAVDLYRVLTENQGSPETAL